MSTTLVCRLFQNFKSDHPILQRRLESLSPSVYSRKHSAIVRPFQTRAIYMHAELKSP